MPQAPEMNARLNVPAPASLVQKVARAAKKRSLSRAEYVRRACIEQLKREKE